MTTGDKGEDDVPAEETGSRGTATSAVGLEQAKEAEEVPIENGNGHERGDGLDHGEDAKEKGADVGTSSDLTQSGVSSLSQKGTERSVTEDKVEDDAPVKGSNSRNTKASVVRFEQEKETKPESIEDERKNYEHGDDHKENVEEKSDQFGACSDLTPSAVSALSQSRKLSHMDTVGTEATYRTETEEPISELQPPPSRAERVRDFCFRFLDIPILRIIGFVVIFLVIVDGAFFFFLMIGAHGMCTPKTDCEPRNWWLNWSIQVLNGLFTYTAILTLAPRLSDAIHLASSRRSSEIGRDYYGRETNKVWYYIPTKRRACITALLMGNCLTQYANQICRIKFYSFDLSNSWPGVLWVNLWFVLAFSLAGVGALWQIYEEHKLHINAPEKFPPGPVVILQERRKQLSEQSDRLRRKKKRKDDQGDDGKDEGKSEGDVEEGKMKRRTSGFTVNTENMKEVQRKMASPWKKLARWFRSIRPSMRMW
eukprot:CAMPEP_0197444846 /NCGR_PEP_ID=MMETSP1175-20131217/10206_1 /TAXON_ID=1003142 /ORGANISM="Triceratium dubium, Strain CCMP147" /LENGTH=480 /DNA_ID=CAMNT_0042975699 /DNA_START=47 /DNA_END=1486 /DNA_ORIENTATION=+